LAIFAQQSTIDKAAILVKSGKTEKAIALLNKSYSKTKDVKLAYEIIAILGENKQVNEALVWAQKIGMENNTNSIDVAVYAKLLLLNKDYHAALQHCKKYLLNHQDSVVTEIANACQNLIDAQHQSYQFTIKKVPFNSIYDEISITNFRRHFVMSSNGEIAFIEGSKNFGNFDFYLLQQDYQKWRYPTKFLRNNDYSIQKSTLGFSQNGNDVFYTNSAQKSVSSKSKMPPPLPNFKIRHAISLGNEWLNDTLLEFQQAAFSYKDPTLHPNEKLLVFASDLENKGHFDLFYSEKVEDKWSEPKSLGNQVNSTYDETMPYFKADGTLYFSSNRPFGFGGYDIYTTQLDGNIWLQSKIMPPPLNSEFDDQSLIFNYGFPGGYFVSNRTESLGGYDVFEFSEFKFNLNAIVLDDEFGSFLSYAEVSLYLDSNLVAEGVTNTKGFTEFTVGPNIKYRIVVTKEGYQKLERTIETNYKNEETTIYQNCRLIKDKTYTKADENQLNNQDFITFTAKFINEKNEPLSNFPVKITNVKQGRIKYLNTNDLGEIEQLLFLNNEYQFSVETNKENIVNTFSTIGLNSSENKNVTFVIQQ
jgi:hypothetical protein